MHMLATPLSRAVLSSGGVLSFALSGPLSAQTPRELALRDAFLTSPITALPPIEPANQQSRAALRVGGWLYYHYEPIHWNVGISAPFQLSRTTRAHVTAARAGAACTGCRSWLLGAIDAERSLTPWLSVRGSAGVGHPGEWTSQSSASIGAAIIVHGDYHGLRGSLHPGLALAGISTDGLRARGVRPTLGFTLGWQLFSRVAISLGGQAVANHGSAPVFGVGAVWTRRPNRAVQSDL